MNITRYQQWKQRITSRELVSAFGLTETMAELLQRHRFRWLGHVARMDPCRLPKQLLFGELEKPRPRHGVKRRWHDLVLADIRAMGIEDWYTAAQDRRKWATMCQRTDFDAVNATGDGICAANTSQPTHTFQCVCGRIFRRRGDLRRHSRFCDGVCRAQLSHSPSTDHTPACVAGPYGAEGILHGISVFAQLHCSCSPSFIQGDAQSSPQDIAIIYAWATFKVQGVCVCVCVCVRACVRASVCVCMLLVFCHHVYLDLVAQVIDKDMQNKVITE